MNTRSLPWEGTTESDTHPHWPVWSQSYSRTWSGVTTRSFLGFSTAFHHMTGRGLDMWNKTYWNTCAKHCKFHCVTNLLMELWWSKWVTISSYVVIGMCYSCDKDSHGHVSYHQFVAFLNWVEHPFDGTTAKVGPWKGSTQLPHIICCNTLCRPLLDGKVHGAALERTEKLWPW